MPLVLADRVKETTTTTGTGTITLLGAVTGFQAFSVIGNGNTTYYCIAGQGTSEWEVGVGTYTASGTTLSRDTVLASSAGAPTKTNFSGGTKDVFVTYPSERSVYSDGTNIVPDNAAVLGVGSGGTGQSTYTNGQLLIGNTTGNTLDKATLTAGTGITVTNGAGSITIAATSTGTVTSVAAGAGMSFTTITASGSVAMGTPSTITNTTTNSTSGTTHEHALTGELVETTTGSPLYYGSRAWVNWNGTGTVAIRSSVNVSSITDNGGLGTYTVNFTTSMPDANYGIAAFVGSTTTGVSRCIDNGGVTPTTSSLRITTRNSASGATTDDSIICVSIFR